MNRAGGGREEFGGQVLTTWGGLDIVVDNAGVDNAGTTRNGLLLRMS